MPAAGPMISCLMVSRGALFPARLAIACYQRQSYPNRELVIVCEDRDAPLRAHVAALGDPGIRWIDTAPQSLGELRNVSIAHAQGALLAIWDDDDLHHPDRLARQAALLCERHGAAALFLDCWWMWWPAQARLALSGRRAWEGSMLAWRDAVPAYPALSLDEDRIMAEMLIGLHGGVYLDAPELYIYVVHGNNSWHRAHFDELFGWASEIDAAAYPDALAKLARVLPIAAYQAGLEADGRLR